MDAGVYDYSAGIVSLLAAPIFFDLNSKLGFSSLTREIVPKEKEESINVDNWASKKKEVEKEISSFLHFRRKHALVLPNTERPVRLSDYTNNNRLAKVTNLLTVTNDFARKILNAGPEELFDVSKIDGEGKGVRSIKRTKTSITRGHPDLPIVSKNYESYEMAVKMLPGGTDRYRSVLQEVRRSFQTTGAKPMIAGLTFNPAKEKEDISVPPISVSSSDLPEYASELKTRKRLKYDKRIQQIEYLRQLEAQGLLSSADAERQINELLNQKPTKGTILQTIHEFSQDNALEVTVVEPRLNNKSLGYFLDRWKKFAPPKSYASANYEESFNDFVHFLLQDNGLESEKVYVLPSSEEKIGLIIPVEEEDEFTRRDREREARRQGR